MEEQYINTSLELADFISKSPTAFHSVKSMADILKEAGYVRLFEEKKWQISPNEKYYVVRNDSSIIAVSLGDCTDDFGFNITASHSDSPAFKIKENAVLEASKKYSKLNTEGYGGMLCAPWLDRPLSIAGRAVVKLEDRFESRLINIDRDLLIIPNLAIHMNRNANEGVSYNKQVDMLPLIGGSDFKEEDFKRLIADAAGVKPKEVYGTDLYLYNRMPASVWGAKNEYLSAPRLDDLQCAYACLKGFLASENTGNINVFVCLDNEEVGSNTKQGAASTFLEDVLERLVKALGKDDEDIRRAIATGMMLSCDNAHSVHPNHPEKTDDKNCVFMNDGIVIKSHAGQKYTSDALSIAIFKEICSRAKVPVQYFSNRSDMAGGSTLGNIAMTKVSIKCIDIGLAQLAMHSPYETVGIKDTLYMIDAVKEFYNSCLSYDSKGNFSIKSLK